MKRPTMQSDPAGLAGTIGAIIGAIITLLVAFGVELSPAQVQAILGLVAVAGPLVVAAVVRRYAWAPDSVARRTEQAISVGQRRQTYPPP